MNTSKVFNFLKYNVGGVNFVATINGDRPSNRPFGDPVWFDNKIYVLTNKQKQVSKQIAINNKVCIVAYDRENEQWLRINCELVDDSNNVAAKQAIIEEFPWTAEAGYTLDNPDFQVLYLSEIEANVFDVNGQVVDE
jgi:uncharacterized pyridoxamine 5'-phosphate oxidase family protein